jgi:hypothetical protein
MGNANFNRSVRRGQLEAVLRSNMGQQLLKLFSTFACSCSGSPVDGTFLVEAGTVIARVSSVWWGMVQGGELTSPSPAGPVFRKWEEVTGNF